MKIIAHATYAGLHKVRCDCRPIKVGQVCSVCGYDPEKEELRLDALRSEVRDGCANGADTTYTADL